MSNWLVTNDFYIDVGITYYYYICIHIYLKLTDEKKKIKPHKKNRAFICYLFVIFFVWLFFWRWAKSMKFLHHKKILYINNNNNNVSKHIAAIKFNETKFKWIQWMYQTHGSNETRQEKIAPVQSFIYLFKMHSTHFFFLSK